tara:strand:+ start:871 stop:1200 length:330 start_codon:yes stop_codon:yes gene_type:complete
MVTWTKALSDTRGGGLADSHVEAIEVYLASLSDDSMKELLEDVVDSEKDNILAGVRDSNFASNFNRYLSTVQLWRKGVTKKGLAYVKERRGKMNNLFKTILLQYHQAAS